MNERIIMISKLYALAVQNKHDEDHMNHFNNEINSFLVDLKIRKMYENNNFTVKLIQTLSYRLKELSKDDLEHKESAYKAARYIEDVLGFLFFETKMLTSHFVSWCLERDSSMMFGEDDGGNKTIYAKTFSDRLIYTHVSTGVKEHIKHIYLKHFRSQYDDDPLGMHFSSKTPNRSLPILVKLTKTKSEYWTAYEEGENELIEALKKELGDEVNVSCRGWAGSFKFMSDTFGHFFKPKWQVGDTDLSVYRNSVIAWAKGIEEVKNVFTSDN